MSLNARPLLWYTLIIYSLKSDDPVLRRMLHSTDAYVVLFNIFDNGEFEQYQVRDIGFCISVQKLLVDAVWLNEIDLSVRNPENNFGSQFLCTDKQEHFLKFIKNISVRTIINKINIYTTMVTVWFAVSCAKFKKVFTNFEIYT